MMLNAQQVETKKTFDGVPEAGDIAISIDAVPILDFFGNLIGGNGLNTAPNFDFVTPNQSFVVKYFVEPNKAYRFGLVLGHRAVTNYTEVPALPLASPVTYVNDKVTNRNTELGLSAGLEWRRGYGRLYGVYGGEAGLSVASRKNSYKYGNVLSDDNALVNRLASRSFGVEYGIGARAFAGVEYFILPKISLAGEFGWGLSLGLETRGTDNVHSWDGVKKVVDKEKTKTGSQRLIFDATNENSSTIFGPAGQLRLTFHF